MSSVNYTLKNKGVRLIDSQEAWIFGKNGKFKLNPKYHFIGKIDMSAPNIIFNADDKKPISYQGDVCDLNNVVKKQIVKHFYKSNGKRNSKSKAYFVIEKK